MSDTISKQPSDIAPSSDEVATLNLLVNTLLGMLTLTTPKERKQSILTAVMLIMTCSWEDMVDCYSKAVKLAEKREVKVKDIQNILGDEA